MNKIVREHYPVSKLPEDLRAEFEGQETVRVVIEPERQSMSPEMRDFWATPIEQLKPRTREQFIADLEQLEKLGLRKTTPEEAVARIRELRDEWDDE